jgi:hypothetical protein
MDAQARRDLDEFITRGDIENERVQILDPTFPVARLRPPEPVKLEQAAMIVRKGRCKEDGYTEPYALLADGRTMPMGWNASGAIFEVGTRGTAVYVSASGRGLWRFTPEEA